MVLLFVCMAHHLSLFGMPSLAATLSCVAQPSSRIAVFNLHCKNLQLLQDPQTSSHRLALSRVPSFPRSLRSSVSVATCVSGPFLVSVNSAAFEHGLTSNRWVFVAEAFSNSMATIAHVVFLSKCSSLCYFVISGISIDPNRAPTTTKSSSNHVSSCLSLPSGAATSRVSVLFWTPCWFLFSIQTFRRCVLSSPSSSSQFTAWCGEGPSNGCETKVLSARHFPRTILCKVGMAKITDLISCTESHDTEPLETFGARGLLMTARCRKESKSLPATDQSWCGYFGLNDHGQDLLLWSTGGRHKMFPPARSRVGSSSEPVVELQDRTTSQREKLDQKKGRRDGNTEQKMALLPFGDCRHPTPEPPNEAPALGQTNGARRPDLKGQANPMAANGQHPPFPTFAPLCPSEKIAEESDNFRPYLELYASVVWPWLQ